MNEYRVFLHYVAKMYAMGDVLDYKVYYIRAKDKQESSRIAKRRFSAWVRREKKNNRSVKEVKVHYINSTKVGHQFELIPDIHEEGAPPYANRGVS